MNSLSKGKPYSQYPTDNKPFTTSYTNALHAISTNSFYFPTKNNNVAAAKGNHFTKSATAIAAVNTDKTPFAFTCRQGKVVMTACDVSEDIRYETASFTVGQNHNTTTSDQQAISHQDMKKIICPTLTTHSPYIPEDDAKETSVTVTHPKILTHNQQNPKTTTQKVSTSQHKSKSQLLDDKQIKNNIAAAISSGVVYLHKYPTSISKPLTPNDNQRILMLDCQNKGYSGDLYYAAEPWEAFACISNTAHTHSETLPSLMVSVCTPNKKLRMHSFIKNDPLPKKESLARTNIPKYKCYTIDHLLAGRTKTTKQINKNNDAVMSHAQTNTQIENTLIRVASCAHETNNIPPCIITKTTLQFDRSMIGRMLTQTSNQTLKINNTFLNNPATNIDQFGRTVDTDLILPCEEIQESCPTKECSTGDLISAISIICASVLLTLCAAILCITRKPMRSPKKKTQHCEDMDKLLKATPNINHNQNKETTQSTVENAEATAAHSPPPQINK